MAAEKTGQSAFNPHHFVKDMAGRGMPEGQAEGIADAMTGMINSELATKQDMELVRKDMAIGLERVKLEMIRWVIGSFLGTATLIVGLAGIILSR